jgi:hypothetical protein
MVLLNHQEEVRVMNLQEIKNLFTRQCERMQYDFSEATYGEMVNDFANLYASSYEEYMTIWEMLI